MPSRTVSIDSGKKKKSDNGADLRDQLKIRVVEPRMVGRSQTADDLRSKLDKKKGDVEDVKSKWEDEPSLDSSYEDKRTPRKGKENETDRKREPERSVKVHKDTRRESSRDRTKRRDRSRSRSRDHHRHHDKPRRRSRSRSLSRRRKPLSEKASDKLKVKSKRDNRSRDRSERKRNISPVESPKKSKVKKESQSPSPVEEKVEKKKKKTKVDGEEKVKKKKKKSKDKKKEKKEKAAEEEKNGKDDVITAENDDVITGDGDKDVNGKDYITSDHDPQSRKYRIDSGISVGSGERTDKKLEPEPVRSQSKVSDSLLSAPSLTSSQNSPDFQHDAQSLLGGELVVPEAPFSGIGKDVRGTGDDDLNMPPEQPKSKKSKSHKSSKEKSRSAVHEKEASVEQEARSLEKRESEKRERSLDHKDRSPDRRERPYEKRVRRDRDFDVRGGGRRDYDSRTRDYKRGATPDRYHHRRPRSVDRRYKSPIRRNRTPDRRERSPRKYESPLRRERSPRRLDRSPERRERSPRRLERSPERRARSPRADSPVRQERSPRGFERTPERLVVERSLDDSQDKPIETEAISPDKLAEEGISTDGKVSTSEDMRPTSRNSTTQRLMDIAGSGDNLIKSEETAYPERAAKLSPRRDLSPRSSRPRDSFDRRGRSPDRFRGRPYSRRYSPRDRHDRSRERRDFRPRSRERDYPPRRFSRDVDYREPRHDNRFNRRFSADQQTRPYDRNESWEDKVSDFICKIGAAAPVLRELPREDGVVAAFDPSRPPPIPIVPEHQSTYRDAAFPSFPSPNIQDDLALSKPTIVSGPRYSPEWSGAEIHTAVSVDDSFDRSSRERDSKPLTAKEKKKQAIKEQEIWQYVANKLLDDPIFIKRKKKRAGSEEEEDMKEKAEKCVIRIAQKLEKGGFKEERLWKTLKDNERGVEGFIDAMKVQVTEGFIEVDRESKKPKDKLDADLLTKGVVFRYIGEFIHQSLAVKSRRESGNSIDNMSTNVLQSILKTALKFPTPVPADSAQTPFTLAVKSFRDIEKFITVQLVQSLCLEPEKARATSALYVETLVIAEFNIDNLADTIRNYCPPEPEFEGEPAQTVYGHLLETLRDVPFDKYPRQLTDSGLDAHQTNIVRISLEYFSQLTKPKSPSPRPSLRTVGEEEDGFIGPLPSEEIVPVGGNSVNQLPQRRYVLVSVSVDTVSVDGRLVVWQISAHIPDLPEDEDPDYECLMLPTVLADKSHILNDLGFTFDNERNMFYHQGTEFGRRKAESEEISLEKFANYLDEIRNGLKGAGRNNGLVLLFETGEDLALVKQLFARHSHDVFFDVVKGLSCLDHYLRVSRPGRPAAYTWPSYQYKVGDGGKWTSTITNSAVGTKIEALTKPECIYNICEGLLGSPPSYSSFTKWFSYPVNHPEISTMTANLEHTLELLPLQNHLDRQLFTNRVEVMLEGVFSARSEVEATRPYNACARQTIRRLVALGFNLEVLKKSFRSDPSYAIPATVFLQDMTEVEKLRVHGQTDQIRSFIKSFFVRQ